jgi:thiamine-monophosphate kinase
MRSEFDLIQNLKFRFALDRVGDDCAVLPKNETHDMVVTADMLVENVDFRLNWTTPESLGNKALAVSLSDIAAMGAGAVWAMLSIAVPELLWNSEFVDRFYHGWHQLAREFGVELVGGDVSASPNGVVIDSIVGGEVVKGTAIMRSGAKPGDSIFVSGSLGGAAGGLALLETGRKDAAKMSDLILRQLRPRPQLAMANLLKQLGSLSSMIDISDGLSSDLGHLCTASGAGAAIHAEMIPVDVGLGGVFDPDRCLDLALNGGEDFELLFTSSEKNIFLPEPHQISRIGEITSNDGIIELMVNGHASVLEPKGYRHF